MALDWALLTKFICLGFFAVSMVFQLFNGNSSQIHVSKTIFEPVFNSFPHNDTF